MRHERLRPVPTRTETTNALMANSAVLTLDGALSVDQLVPGDRIITRDSGAALLQAVRVSQTSTRFVRIEPGTLGPQRPGAPVVLPTRAQVLLRGDHALALCGRPRAIVPAGRLVDGILVHDAGRLALPLFELIFDAPHILYVDGLELASAAPLKAPSRATPLAAPRAGLRR